MVVFKKKNGWVCLVMVGMLTLLCGFTALADDGVILQYKGVAGDVSNYKTVTNGKIKISLGGLEQTMKMGITQSFSGKVIGASDDGKLYMDVTFQGQSITLNGKQIPVPAEQNLVGKKATVLMENSGKIIEVSGDLLDSAKIKDFKQIFSQTNSEFPKDPVKIGQEWVNEISYNIPNTLGGGEIPMTVRMKYKLLGIENFNGKQAAKILASMYGTLKGDLKDPKGSVVGLNAVFSGSGVHYFAIDEGRLLNSTGKMNIKMTMNVKGGDNNQQKINMSMDMDSLTSLQ